MQPNGLDRLAGLVRPGEKTAYAHLQDEELEQTRDLSRRRWSWTPSVSQVLLFLISVALLSATGVHHFRESEHSHNQPTSTKYFSKVMGAVLTWRLQMWEISKRSEVRRCSRRPIPQVRLRSWMLHGTSSSMSVSGRGSLTPRARLTQLSGHFMLIPDEDFPKSEFRTREPLRASTSTQNGTLGVFEYVHALHCVVSIANSLPTDSCTRLTCPST